MATVFKKMSLRDQVLLVHTARKMPVIEASVTLESKKGEIGDDDHDGDGHSVDGDVDDGAKEKAGNSKSGHCNKNTSHISVRISYYQNGAKKSTYFRQFPPILKKLNSSIKCVTKTVFLKLWQ
jgi:hypothetical protein